MPTSDHSPSAFDSDRNIAVVLGGGGNVFAEYEIARPMCEAAGLTITTFVANDMIEMFPGVIDKAITLHPDKLRHWIPARSKNCYPPLTQIWAHRDFENVTHWTRDYGGSSGLFSVKVARENGFTKILLCGVPMTVEADHVKRLAPWNAAHGFRRAWQKQRASLLPFVRSMSGWTAEQFGAPSSDWLAANIIDPDPQRPQPVGLKA